MNAAIGRRITQAERDVNIVANGRQQYDVNGAVCIPSLIMR